MVVPSASSHPLDGGKHPCRAGKVSGGRGCGCQYEYELSKLLFTFTECDLLIRCPKLPWKLLQVGGNYRRRYSGRSPRSALSNGEAAAHCIET